MISFSCESASEEYVIKKFGQAFNEERKEIGLAPVTSGMEVVEASPWARYIFVNEERSSAKKPVYVRKIIALVSGGDSITVESDLYFNPQENRELSYEHSFIRNETFIVLQNTDIDDDKPKDLPGIIIGSDDNKGIGFQQADSILKAWGIKAPERKK